MSDGSAKPVIFISYSHKDRSWLDYVRSFFEPLAEHWTLQIWDDEKLRIGDDWRGDIYSALDASRIFILLVSRYALASNFIRTEEVGHILKRPKGQVQFCPVVVTPYYTRPLAWLDHPNRRPKDGKALSEFPDPERDREMAVIAGQIDEIIESMAVRSASSNGRPPSFAIPAPRIAFPSIVDYGRLPETPYKTLVGRDDELRRLDDAWADEATRIISLVAWGGAGKSSLVIEWLTRVRNDGYRNADAVLCWSFYSQGTTERAASDEGFLDWALGKLKVKIDTTSSIAKGERLAEELSRRGVLLVLDGLEPLQYGSEGQQGALRDQGLRAFLRGVAAKQPAAGHSLVVLTSRLAVYDLRKWQGNTAPLVDLGRLSDEAGAALLADGGVKGSAEALREAAHDFDGHALALSLLAGFLRLLHGGDVSQRGRIRLVTDEPEDAGHDQARRVIETYNQDWLAHEPVLLAIVYLIGLFDRPASADCMLALRSKPVIDGLTDAVVDLHDDAWRAAIKRLRDVRLLDPEDPSAPDALDAHPLVREWFGDRLRQTNEAAWEAAHGRVYEHLRDTTREGSEPTLEDLAPLYQAISHGCRAGRHQEALEEIYKERICRWRPSREIEFYASLHLGAFGSDLAAISWFFDRPFEIPIHTLSEAARSWVLSVAAFTLRAQGRFSEALPAMRIGLGREEEAGDWYNAAITASNLSDAELLKGEVTTSVATAKRCIAHGDRSGSEFLKMALRTTYANALHAAGQFKAAQRLFAEAERRQKEIDPSHPLLRSIGNYLRCDLLMVNRSYREAYERATKVLGWELPTHPLLDRGLARLALGRALLGLALQNTRRRQQTGKANVDVRATRIRLNEAVDGLRSAGTNDHIPRGLLARAAFRRSMGDWQGAVRDLDEVEEIAEPGPMKLYLCDAALERSRLAFARIDAFAPLNGRIDDSPPKPVASDAAGVGILEEEAAKQLAIAADYIKNCGYHRRDEALAELQAVLRGEREFIDLPPRV